MTVERTAARVESGDDRALPPPAADPVVQARSLSKRYGDRFAVRHLDLDIPRGTIFGFIGPSGSGKTTTVRLLLGISQPTAGEVRVLGARPREFTTAQRRRLGYMPQLTSLYPHLSIAQNLKFVASIYGLLRGRRRRLREVLELVELAGDRRKLLRDASGGMQRRVSLAATLLHDPELIFLDEPTAGIDPVLRRKFWDHFAHLQRAGRTVCVTTQYVGEAGYCDLVAVLSGGRLVAVDSPDGLRRRAFGGEHVDFVASEPLEEPLLAEMRSLPAVNDTERTRTDGRGVRVLVPDAEVALATLPAWLGERGVRLQSLQRHVASFDDVFVQLVDSSRPPPGEEERRG